MNAVTFTKNALVCGVLSVLSISVFAQGQAHGLSDGTQLYGTTAKALLDLNAPYGLSQAQLDELANSTTWQRLLLMQKGKSQIKDSQFFLADDGRTNPKNELIATLNAMQQGNQKAQCQFVARTHFLRSELTKLGINADKQGACAEFDAWAKSLDAGTTSGALSLIFADEHPNALGSAFAHAFLKLDTNKSLASGQDSDAIAINYSSIRSKSESEAIAALKSVVGAYNSGLDIVNYAKKQDEYIVKGERDIWQYKIALSSDELQQIIRHLWETKDLQRPYFFTHNNCATEIVRLIDVVRPDKNIAKDMGNIVVPSKIAYILDKHGMVQETIFLPSNATKRQALINNGKDFDFASLKPNNNNPIHASATHRIGVGAGYDDSHGGTNQGKGKIYTLSLTSAYQDDLNRPAGVRKFHNVLLPSLDIVVDDEKVKVDKLTLFSSRSYNPINTAKNNPDPQTGKPKNAWGLHLGFRQVTDASGADNSDHLVMDNRIEYGRSWTMGKGASGTGDLADSLCYVLGGVGAQIGKINQGYRVGVGANMGCIHHASDNVRFVGELLLPVWYHHDPSDSRSAYLQPSVSLGMQYDLSRNHALRLTGNIEKVHGDTQERVQLQYLRYF